MAVALTVHSGEILTFQCRRCVCDAGSPSASRPGYLPLVNAIVAIARLLMCLRVAFSAQGDQVLFHVAARLAPEPEVVHLQVSHASASLAPPVVTLQHLSMQFSVTRRIKSESRGFAADLLFHEAFRLTCDRKASRCGPGRNL